MTWMAEAVCLGLIFVGFRDLLRTYFPDRTMRRYESLLQSGCDRAGTTVEEAEEYFRLAALMLPNVRDDFFSHLDEIEARSGRNAAADWILALVKGAQDRMNNNGPEEQMMMDLNQV
ncbi:unnamed protein product, partial [Mesorhabditis spiculigera]